MEQSKKKIAVLVEKYNQLKKENKIKDYNEAQTLSGFIEPLFMALGWDVHNLGEVTPEENISGDRVDRAFRINGIIKFFLEAKSMKADLDLESYARQAIKYSWNKGVNYAVLTDFEGIKVFNANAKSKSLRDKIIFQISCENYITDFEKLWLLSKESFEKNKLDKYAESIFKKSQKLTVNEKLYGDLKEARIILTNSFRNWNSKVDQEDLDEGVQRILDRLVFIRVLEDKKLEDLILRPLTRDEKNNQEIFHSLIGKFRELDDIYNSNLFHEHSCEKWENYDVGEFKKVIELLYGNDAYEYDFKEIPADILGGVYESYLGYIAQNPINVGHKKGKLFELDDKNEIKIKSRQKRKEHGIYYTPKFIVDYIVKNTLGEKLKEIKSMADLKKIKVLDPACGSGSFLTRALEEINNKYKDFGNPGKQETKTEIILSNIYGVDLDAQATELAKLNLLLDTLDKKAKLPSIGNVRVGNSLISGTEAELKKYFGKNWQDKKPFNWEEEFPEVFSQGGFDVIIGNPPYVNAKNSNFTNEEKKYFNDNFETASYQLDTYILFLEKSIKLLREDGLIGFIIPNSWLSNILFVKIRKFLLDNTEIIEIVESKDKIFENASVDVVVFIARKKKDNGDNYVKKGTFERGSYRSDFDIVQSTFNKNDFVFNINLDSGNRNFINKIELNSMKIQDILDVSTGIKEYQVGKGTPPQKQEDKNESKFNAKTKKDETFMPEIRGKNITRYALNWNNEYVSYGKWIAEPRNPKYFTGERVLIRKIPGIKNLVISWTNKDFIVDQSVYVGILNNENFNIKYIIAILNSKLMGWYFKNKHNEFDDLFPQIKVTQFKNLPISLANKKEQKILGELAYKMIEFNKQFQIIPKNSDKWNSIKKEIEKTDKEIDGKVYELYGLTEDEIRIVESN